MGSHPIEFFELREHFIPANWAISQEAGRSHTTRHQPKSNMHCACIALSQERECPFLYSRRMKCREVGKKSRRFRQDFRRQLSFCGKMPAHPRQIRLHGDSSTYAPAGKKVIQTLFRAFTTSEPMDAGQ